MHRKLAPSYAFQSADPFSFLPSGAHDKSFSNMVEFNVVVLLAFAAWTVAQTASSSFGPGPSSTFITSPTRPVSDAAGTGM